jgi:hypothetical protein
LATTTKLKPFKIGNSRNIRVTVKDSVTGNPIDITGDKFYFTVKDTADHTDTDAVVQESVVAAGANATSGIAIINVPAASTTSVTPGTYEFDIVWLKLTSAPGDRETILQGDVDFAYPVTRAQS